MDYRVVGCAFTAAFFFSHENRDHRGRVSSAVD